MSEKMMSALIGAGVALITTIVTTIVNAIINKNKCKMEIKLKEQQTKREHLNEVYKSLIAIINLYPNSSPNDIMYGVQYAPNYSMEGFDSVLKSLDYLAEDYNEQLKITNIDYEQKYYIESQISNIEYSKKKIHDIKYRYFSAQDKYNSFYESDKVVFDLYAGANVRNCLVDFEVMIHNVFKSGRYVGNADDPINNCIEINRRNLIDSMRLDIGVF